MFSQFHKKRQNNTEHDFHFSRIQIMQGILIFLFGIIFYRLFEIQVIHGAEYTEQAEGLMSSTTEIPAERGEILAKDGSKLAISTTLDLVYVDPKETPDRRKVADLLAPVLYTKKDYEDCLEEPKYCPEGSVEIIRFDDEEEVNRPPKYIFPEYEEAIKAFADEIFRDINRDKIDFLTLKRGVSDEILNKVVAANLPGIDIIREKFLVYVDPTQVPQETKRMEKIAIELSEILEIPKKNIFDRLKAKDLRYVMLKQRIRPEVSEKIRELKDISREAHQNSTRELVAKKLDTKNATPDYFRGVVLIPERWRYYPEGELASQVLGYVDRDGIGRYGIEGKLETTLSGKTGVIESRKNVKGVDVDPRKIVNSEDGVSVMLTIDRVIQKKVEEILNEKAKEFNADSAQIIVADPFSGKILALANYPTFNPNEYWRASEIRRTRHDDFDNVYKTTPIFTKDEYGRFQKSEKEEFEDAWRMKFDPEFYIYRNGLGAGAYVNRTVQETYEPGSVFKPIAMAIGIENGEVEPNTMCNEDGSVWIGQFEIKTATEKYEGWMNMNKALALSSNPCMVEEVAFPLGKSVMHSYIVDKFGFKDYTNIMLEDEQTGIVRPKKDWSDAHLATSSYGQGLTATPIQVLRAWMAIANGGNLIRPQIIEKRIWPDGRQEEYEKEHIRRVLTPETSSKMTSMLVYSVDEGVAYAGAVPGYSIAGKTGSSQIVDPDTGRYEEGEGAVITSFAGYAPANDPQFLVLVKFDRPRLKSWDSTWGSTTAAPVFREVMSYLFENANIPPDR